MRVGISCNTINHQRQIYQDVITNSGTLYLNIPGCDN